MLVRSIILLLLLLGGCQTKNELVESQPYEQGRKNKLYVKTLMHQYVAPSERKNRSLPLTLPPPPIGFSYLTVGATYKGDTLRILLHTVRELVEISEIAGSPTDSAYIASLVKGDNLLKLDGEAIKEVSIIKPWASVDSVRSQGKQYTLNYYFKKKWIPKSPP